MSSILVLVFMISIKEDFIIVLCGFLVSTDMDLCESRKGMLVGGNCNN